MTDKPEGYLMMTMLTPKDVNNIIMDVCTNMDADQADAFISHDDRKDIFLKILKGSSDVTKQLIDELCVDYSVDLHATDDAPSAHTSIKDIVLSIKNMITVLQQILPPDTNKRAMSLYKLREAIWWLGVED